MTEDSIPGLKIPSFGVHGRSSGRTELELGIIRERVAAGVAKARRTKEHWGRPRAIFDHQEARRLRHEGWSSRKIAEELGVSKDTVLACLR